MSTKVTFVTIKFTFVITIFNFVDKIHFCRQNSLLSQQNSILSWQNSILLTKFTFVRTKVNFVTQIHCCCYKTPSVVTKFTFVVTELTFVKTNFTFVDVIKFLESSLCKLVTDWLKHLHGEGISNLKRLINIDYLLNIHVNITVMWWFTFPWKTLHRCWNTFIQIFLFSRRQKLDIVTCHLSCRKILKCSRPRQCIWRQICYCLRHIYV